MNIKKVTLSSPIQEKIAWSEAFCHEFRDQLLKDKTIVELLNKLENAIRASHSEMTKTGIATICRECEQDEGGSCCGVGLENRYDWELLLINLLLDVNLPQKRHDPESCFFLGETGCLLQARHVICINYVCKKITDLVDPQKLNALRQREGEELNTLFLLHERIKKMANVRAKSLLQDPPNQRYLFPAS
ncbi:MAG: hypothetical protein JRJ86_03235 [Deltaproteobacteria bacterium]|nr:hypothetical protein [Deltaproteobacteria bacterium]